MSDRRAYLEEQIERQKRGEPIDVEWVRAELARVRQEQAAHRARTQRKRRRPSLQGDWWRHVVAVFAILVALFPVVYTVSSAFNRDNSLQGATLVPTHVTLHNFGSLLHNNVTLKSGGTTDAPYLRWVFNSMVIAGATGVAAADGAAGAGS